MEQELACFRDIKNARGFVDFLEGIILDTLPEDSRTSRYQTSSPRPHLAVPLSLPTTLP